MIPRRFWIGAAAFWFAFGLVAGTQVWISMVDHGHFVPLLIGHFVLVWEGWLVFTVVIVRLTRRFPIVPVTRRNLLIHALAACLIGVIHGAYWMMLTLTMRPYDRMTVSWAQINIAENLFYRLPAELILYAAVAGAIQAAGYYARYRERELEAARLQASLTSVRLHALELQLQPHFLFNTLNAVTSLVRTRKNDEAVTMIAGLSDLLRYSLDHEGNQRVTVEAEAEILRRYLEIQRARFADRLRYSIDVDSAVRKAAVPTLILQPLAENAVRHGIGRSAEGGSLSVRAFRENGCLRVDVKNSGRLAADGAEGVGLRNTRERLKQLYGDDGRFSIRQADDGVVATLRIPWSELA
ncbi:MAG TPA: histidine kinase [Thermoanaerobaculia bacterium]|nr:histidine kinase [Thermoanaerobaculia bacterium]